MKKIIFLSFCILIYGNLDFAKNSPQKITKKSGLSIGYLSNDTPGSCGCFAWLGNKPHTSGKLIYQELETNDKNFLNVKIDGVILNLVKKPVAPITDKYFSSKVGENIEEHLISSDLEVITKWKTIKIHSPADDESARNVTFDVSFHFRSTGKEKKIKAAGYCGC